MSSNNKQFIIKQTINQITFTICMEPDEFHFAQKFKPIFRASDIYKFCNNPKESTQFRFLIKFNPFKDYVRRIRQEEEKKQLEVKKQLEQLRKQLTERHQQESAQSSQILHLTNVQSSNTSKVLLNEDEKNHIINKLNETLSEDSLLFDDDSLVQEIVKKSENELRKNVSLAHSGSVSSTLTDIVDGGQYISPWKIDASVDQLSFNLKNMLLTDDENSNSNSDEESYYSAQEDEEAFKKAVENELNQVSLIKREPLALLMDEETFLMNKKLQAQRYVSTRRGIIAEKFILSRLNREMNMNFVKNNKTYRHDFEFFDLIGIIDGIDESKKMIAEIKTRKNTLDKNKKTISNKERIQALCYMKLTGATKCLFVESDCNGEQKLETIEYDEAEFNKYVHNKLLEFTKIHRELTEKDFKELASKYLNS
jgi:hypothetical protein